MRFGEMGCVVKFCCDCEYCFEDTNFGLHCKKCFSRSGFTPKEKVMESKLDFKSACEAIDKVSERVICSSGKKAVKEIIGALCGEKVKSWFSSTYENMELGGIDGGFKIRGVCEGYVCTIEDGYLRVMNTVQCDGLRRSGKGRIIVRGPVAVLKGDGNVVDVE